MASTPAGPYTPATPTLGGVLDHAGVHQDIADDIGALTTGAASEASQRIAGDTARQLLTEKGVANGYAGLDTNGKVPAAQLPAVSGAPTGPAGGSLSGTYPDPGIAANAITATELAANSVTTAKLFALAVTTAKISDDQVTNAKLANMAANTIKGAVGAGDPVDLTSSQAAAVVASGSGGGTTNFLRADGTWSAPPSGGSGTPSGPAGGSLGGTYPNPTLAADSVGTTELANNAVTTSELADNSVTTNKIVTDAVTNLSLANMTQATIKGRLAGGGTGDPQDLTSGQATAILDTFTSGLKGLAPSSGGGTANFLRADGTWSAPAGGGGAPVLVPTSIKTADYSAAVGDDVLCSTAAGSFTVTLPLAPANGSQIRVRLRTSNTAYQVFLVASGGETLDQSGTSLRGTGEWVHYQYQSSTTTWRCVWGLTASATPLSVLAAPEAETWWAGNKLTGLGNATVGTDALNRDTGDARYLTTAQTINVNTDSPVTVAVGRRYTADLTAGSIVYNLPAAPAVNSRVAVSVSAIASSYTATVNCGGSDRFQTPTTGAVSKVLNRVGQVLVVQYHAASAVWLVEEDVAPNLVSGYGTTPNTSVTGDVGIDALVDIQSFSTPGTFTWNQPSWATTTSTVRIWVMGAGGGGGSGRLGATGTVRGGGGGGASANLAVQSFLLLDLTTPITVTVGAGGTGGTAISTADTNGNPGNTGGTSSFGKFLVSSGGTGGAGGTSTDGGVGGTPSSTRGMWQGVNGGVGGGIAAATAGAVSGFAQQSMTSGGGGGGGGFLAANTNAAPASGGGGSLYTDGTAIGGGNQSGGGGLPGGAGGVAQFNMGMGGGGGYRGNNANGTAGGLGGVGGGGGGGGGTTNTWVSGAGGAGGNGSIRVIVTP